MFQTCRSLQVSLAARHQIIWIMWSLVDVQHFMTKHSMSVQSPTLVSGLIAKRTWILQLYCMRGFSTWQSNSKVLVERAVYC
jgi:hypothetical protein